MELELGVEILIWHDIDLPEPRVHVSLRRGQPDDGGGAVRLLLGLGVVVEGVAHLVHQLHQVDLGAGERDLEREYSHATCTKMMGWVRTYEY